MKIDTNVFRVGESDEVKLDKWPTKVKPVYRSKTQYKELLGEHVAKLSDRQQLLYASNRYAVLLIFQAMDAAGKDGAIKHVCRGSIHKAARYSASSIPASPNCNTTSFGEPRAICRNAGESAFSIAHITRMF